MKKLILMWLILMTMVVTACGQADETGELAALPAVEFTVVATDIVYDKPEIEVQAGQPIKVTFRNEGALEHDFTIEQLPLDGEPLTTETDDEQGGHSHDMAELEVDVHVAAAMNGGSNVLQFTPTEPGTYEYYCTVAGHKEAGMVGQLIVTAP